MYDPGILKSELPEGNTIAAEQTFVWLSRFKKILCAIYAKNASLVLSASYGKTQKRLHNYML